MVSDDSSPMSLLSSISSSSAKSGNRSFASRIDFASNLAPASDMWLLLKSSRRVRQLGFEAIARAMAEQPVSPIPHEDKSRDSNVCCPSDILSAAARATAPASPMALFPPRSRETIAHPPRSSFSYRFSIP